MSAQSATLQWTSPARMILRGALRLLLRVRIHREGELFAEGALLVPGRATAMDLVCLQLASPKPVRVVGGIPASFQRLLNPLWMAMGAPECTSRGGESDWEAAQQAVGNGEWVCMIPDGLWGSGDLPAWCREQEVVVRRIGARVLCAVVEPLADISNHASLRRLFVPRCVLFKEVSEGSGQGGGGLLEQHLNLGERAFQMRPELGSHLALEALRGLLRRPGTAAIIDGMDGSVISRGLLLSAALALSGALRRRCPEKRVGIVLPPGKGAAIANLAVMLAGKVPVNLNFTASHSAVEAAMRIAELRHVFTARAFQAKFPEFPWPEDVCFLEDWMKALRPWVLLWRALAAALPADVLAFLARTPRRGDRGEATVLFTSGSSGDPKGVVLSHRNLLGNVSQFAGMLRLPEEARVLACLPVFHSFGSTVTLWYPMLRGMVAVTFPSALDIPKNVELIERHQVSLLCTTPTFLRGYLRRAEAAQLSSLQLIVTGAEKLPMELADAFERKLGKPVMQGYGLTETSPVVSVNLPPVAQEAGGHHAGKVLPQARRGSAGRLAPGMAAEIRDPDSGARLPLDSVGMLWLKGPNIFEGYLNDPVRTSEVLQGGWLRTGDLARMDSDGFVFIEGRLSRFSKIAGEMVPHESVESAIQRVLGLAEEERVFAVAGVPDESKGEALVLLSSMEIDMTELRLRLHETGIPNLWIPKRQVRVDEIPHLASGKLDLRRLQQIALQAG